MERRTFIVGTVTALAAPLAAAAQPETIARIGFLDQFSGPLPSLLSAFRESMTELGYVEGRNLAIDYRFAEGRADRLPELAAELIGLRVDVIIALGPAALEAAKARTATVPIVASDLESDPVAAGFVASLARPGGNMTGTFLDQAEISGKWLELLKTAIPKLSRVAVLWDSTTPSHQLKALTMGAPALTVTLQTLAVRGPEDLEGAFTAAARQHAQGVVILSSPLVLRSGARLADLAAAMRLPTISMFRQNALAGCLMSYGPSLTDRYRRIGSFAARILKGAKPADLPIERPMTFELVINLKTAKALGLAIPPAVLARADEVIQ
jgi:putative tryptophan/tyrosine transport system substrate-binding protein